MALAFRVSWICLLLFSIGTCFPIDSPNNPFTFSLIGPESPSVSLQHEAAGQQTGSPTGNQSPRSLGAPSSAAGFLSDYDPGLAYGSSPDGSSPGAAAGRSFTPWYLNRLPKKTPDLQAQQRSGSDSGGGSTAGGPGPGYDSSFSPGVAYAGSSGPGSASSSGGAAPSSGGGADPFGFPFPGLSPSTFLRHLIPPRLLPDVNAWDTDEVPLGLIEPPAVAPSSYIIQSSNGYQRARELLSHSKYSPDIFDHFLLPPIITQTPSETAVTEAPGEKAK